MRILKQSTNVHVVMGPLVDDADGYTLITAPTLGNITAARIVNGETRTTITLAGSGNNEFTHLADGYFELDLTTTDTGTLGQLTITLRDDDGFLPVWEHFTVVPANVYDSLVGGSDTLDTSVTQWLGTAVTAETAGVPNVNVYAISDGTSEAVSLQAAIDTSDNLVKSDIIHINANATAASNLATIAAGSSTGNGLDANVKAISGDTTAADRLELMMDASPSFTIEDAVFTPTTTAFRVEAGGSPDATDDHYNGLQLKFVTGALAAQTTDVTDYTGSTAQFTVTALTEAPSDGDVFIFI